MLKYVFGAIFIALAWALVMVFHDNLPMWPAVVATAVIGGGLVLLAVFRILMARRAASAIERGLREQAEKHNDGARPDLQAEIAAMASEFQKGVQALKSSKVGRSGRDALSLLPWYVMIGPSASGKTTAIRSSGLKMPAAGKGKVRGVGGTRNCDWWMTNEAILLDTAGRWSTDDDDRDEWLAFLDLLKETRPKKPINGILLAISATDLQGTQEEIGELAHTLRERIDEVIAHLEVVVPVYLILTKCDLIPGFVETFGDLKDNERGQILGFSLPLVSEHEDHVEAFAQHFDELTDVLERNAMVRMGAERRVDAREWIYAFPQQFDSLRQGLVDLVANLFDKSVFQDAPIMRGVYFTSGTQEGRPVDRIMANMAEAFGVRPRMVATPATKPKSYFVRDVFQRVVFPDRDVAVRSAGLLRKQRMVRWGIAAGALVASAALLILPITSYLENQQFITDARAYVEKLAAGRTGRVSSGAPISPAALESTETMAARLARFESNGPDVSLRFGLYPGDRLIDPLHTAVERLVIRPVLDADADRLTAFAHGRADVDASAAMSGLMLHLLLTQQKAADEPAPESDGWKDKWVGVITQTASDRWASMAGEGATTRARHSLENSVKFYTLGVEATGDLLERNSNVVSRVRTAILGANEGDPLADLLRDPSMPRDIHLIDIVGGAVTVFQGNGEKQGGPFVPGAFTPAGWHIFKTRVELLTKDREHDENAWVLAAPRKREGLDMATLQAAYFRRYVDSWKAFLLALTVKEPSNIDDVRSLLKAFVTDRPLESIWRNASKDLIFKDESMIGKLVGKGTGTLDKLKNKVFGGGGADDPNAPDGTHGGGKARDEEPTSPEDVGREFASFLNFGLTKPTGLETYGQILAELQGAVGEQGAPDARAFQQTVKTQRVKLSNLISNYNDNGWEAALLEKILMPPLRGAEVAVSGATGDSANRKWCDGIVVVYDQLLAGKYPFAKGKGIRESHVDDIQKFFQPKTGTLWQYFADSLQADIDHPAGTSVFHVKDQPSVKYKPTLTVFLKRAQELTDMLYPKDPGKIGLTASIRIRPSAPYTKIVFDSGGHKITYFNAKERWDDLAWPSRGAIFHYYFPKGEGELGYTDGEWALFHLLEDGKLTSASDGDDYLAGTWQPPLGEGAIKADVKPAGLLRAFRGMDVPRGIVAGTSGCGH